MGYRLGVDLGTTYSCAAAARDGRVRIVNLGNRSAVMPSAVFVRDDGVLRVGEAADRRGVAEPGSVAREFKRRLGDPTPILVGERSMRPEELMAALVPAIVQAATEREGHPPDDVVVTHPANWGTNKRQLLTDSIAAVGVDVAATITEPEAAAIYYATTERIDAGEVVAVYDLGGGTFDSALLRRTEDGFAIIGKPEGIDRLGGVDFDAAVLAHVNRFLDGRLDLVDPSDPATAHAVARLRADCVEAKEALSSDTDVAIPVLLPGLRTEVRMTRNELEAMIRPAIGDTIGALRRAMHAAGLASEDVSVVLLVGGSSRIPLVAQLVSAQIGRPVAVDVHPKHAVALGAALSTVSAAGASAGAAVDRTLPPPAAEPSVSPAPEPAPAPTPSPPPARVAAAGPSPTDEPVDTDAPPALPTAGGPRASGSRPRRLALLVALALALAGVVGVVIVLSAGEDADGGRAAGSGATPRSGAEPSPETTSPVPTSGAEPTVTVSTPPVTPTASSLGPDPETTVAPESTAVPVDCANPPQTPYVCAESVSVDPAGNLVVPFRPTGFEPRIASAPNRHIHFFFPVLEIAADPLNAGREGPAQTGRWVVWDDPNPFGSGGRIAPYTAAEARAVGASELCVLVSNAVHEVILGSGNCVPLPPEAR